MDGIRPIKPYYNYPQRFSSGEVTKTWSFSRQKKTKVCPALLLLSLAKIRNVNGRLITMNIHEWQTTGMSTALEFPIQQPLPTPAISLLHLGSYQPVLFSGQLGCDHLIM